MGAKVVVCHPSYDEDKADLLGEVIDVPEDQVGVRHNNKPPAFAMKCVLSGVVHLLYAELQRDSVSLAGADRATGSR